MSKVGLAHRLRNLRDTLEQINPRALAVHRMPQHLRRDYDKWRAQCERADEYAERDRGPGGAYAAMLDGTLDAPAMPERVKQYLNVPDDPQFADDVTAEDLAEIYREMLEGNDR